MDFFEKSINAVYHKCYANNDKIQDNGDKIEQNEVLMYVLIHAPKHIPYLSKEYLYKLNFIYNHVSKLIKLHDALPKEFNDNISSEYISRNTGFNKTLLEQKLSIELNSINRLDFNMSESETCLLNNYHIVELDIAEKQYGLDGHLIFELCYPDDSSDFNFLFKENSLIYLSIHIEDKFVNSDSIDNESQYINRKDTYKAIGQICEISSFPNKNTVDNDMDEIVTIKRFKMFFSDPLKSIWNLHEPTYINCNKSLIDIFDENLSSNIEGKLFDLNYIQSEKLNNKIEQVFISSLGRDFYDFFIEQLFLNGCVLKYDSDPKDSEQNSILPSYYVVDNINDFEKIKLFKSTREYNKQNYTTEYSLQDLLSVVHQKILFDNPSISVKSKAINFDIQLINKDENYQDIHKKDIDNKDENTTAVNPFNFLYKSVDVKNSLNHGIRSLELKTICNLPNVYTKVDFTKVKREKRKDKQDLLLGDQPFDEYFVRRKKITLIRSKLHTELLYKVLSDSDFYKKDIPDSYKNEQIASWSTSKIETLFNGGISHYNKVIYNLGNSLDMRPEYPKFKSFKSFDITGKVIVDSDQISRRDKRDTKYKNRKYRFFKQFELKESSFKEASQGENIFYALEVPCSAFHSKYTGIPVIYIPVDINLNANANEYTPLCNGDILIIKIISLDYCYGYKVLSSSAIASDKATKIHTQRYFLGSTENCSISYIETNNENNAPQEKKYFIKQENEESDNTFALTNNQEGICFTYQSKNKESEG
jgi:hypothetical protein